MKNKEKRAVYLKTHQVFCFSPNPDSKRDGKRETLENADAVRGLVAHYIGSIT